MYKDLHIYMFIFVFVFHCYFELILFYALLVLLSFELYYFMNCAMFCCVVWSFVVSVLYYIDCFVE